MSLKACVDLSFIDKAEKEKERRNRHADFINFVEKDGEVEGQMRNPHVFWRIHRSSWLCSRPDQHGILRKVADAIRARIFDVEELKNFHMHICSEEYPDVQDREEDMEILERDWPKFAGLCWYVSKTDVDAFPVGLKREKSRNK